MQLRQAENRIFEISIKINGEYVVKDKLYGAALEEARDKVISIARELYPQEICEVMYGCSDFGGGQTLKPEINNKNKTECSN